METWGGFPRFCGRTETEVYRQPETQDRAWERKWIRSHLSSDRDTEKGGGAFDLKELLLLAVATSIDALAVGITFAFLKVKIWASVGLIGVTTFLLSALGVLIGHKFGARFKSKAELAGGLILVLMGLKILLEHLGLISL